MDSPARDALESRRSCTPLYEALTVLQDATDGRWVDEAYEATTAVECPSPGPGWERYPMDEFSPDLFPDRTHVDLRIRMDVEVLWPVPGIRLHRGERGVVEMTPARGSERPLMETTIRYRLDPTCCPGQGINVTRTVHTRPWLGEGRTGPIWLAEGHRVRFIFDTNLSAVPGASGGPVKVLPGGANWTAYGPARVPVQADEDAPWKLHRAPVVTAYGGKVRAALRTDASGSWQRSTGWGFGPVRSTDAAHVNVRVRNRPTNVSIDNPAPGATVGGKVDIQGFALDPDEKPVRVTAQATGRFVPEETRAEGTGRWNLTWDASAVQDGAHIVHLLFDPVGESPIRRDICVYVGTSAPDDGEACRQAARKRRVAEAPEPEISITEPAEGAHVENPMRIAGTATDPDGGPVEVALRVRRVERVETVLQTSVLVRPDGRWSVPWDTGSIPAGTYDIQATAFDGENRTQVRYCVLIGEPEDAGELLCSRDAAGGPDDPSDPPTTPGFSVWIILAGVASAAMACHGREP